MANKRNSKRKTKAKSKRGRKKKPTGLPLRWRLIVGTLVVVLIAGVVTVKHFESPAGRAQMLDAGLEVHYAQVQQELAGGMRGALEKLGLRRHIRESVKITRVSGNALRYYEWKIDCPASANLVDANLAVTNAVKAAGGRVRESQETHEGRRLRMQVGTRKYTTHVLEFRKPDPVAAKPTPAPEPGRPQVAIVIDDFGYASAGAARDIMNLDIPLTVAVLPELPHSTRMAEMATETGKCLILHLPMEAESQPRADLRPLSPDMPHTEARRLAERYLRSVPGIVGVNNHQGSRATQDRALMDMVMELLSEHGLFFLDSLTSAQSVAFEAAQSAGVPTAQNMLFIDADTEDPQVVAERLRRLVSLAKRHGVAIGIGHPHRWTEQAISDQLPYLRNAGVELVTVKSVVK